MTTGTLIETKLDKRTAERRRAAFQVYRTRLIESVDSALDDAAMDELLESAGELGFNKKRIDGDSEMVRRARVLEARIATAGGAEGMRRENEATEKLAREIEAAKARVRELEKAHVTQYHARRELGLEIAELRRYQNDPLFTGQFEVSDKRRAVDFKDVPGRLPTTADCERAAHDAKAGCGRHRGGR